MSATKRSAAPDEGGNRTVVSICTQSIDIIAERVNTCTRRSVSAKRRRFASFEAWLDAVTALEGGEV